MLSRHSQEMADRRDAPGLMGHYAHIQRENITAWDKCNAGVQVIRLSDADIERFRRYAIPMWFRWAKRDPWPRRPLPLN